MFLLENEDWHIGKQVKLIRSRKKMSQQAAAGLAGMSPSNWSMIEGGERQVQKRSTLEAIARALAVSPTELTGQPYPAPSDDPDGIGGMLPELEDALTGWWVGEVPDDLPTRPWPQVAAQLRHLARDLRPKADLAGQAALLPALIRDLLAYAAGAEHREAALRGLLQAYKSAGYLTHDVNRSGLPTLAVERMRQTAELLEDPADIADVSWRRAHLLSGASRKRQYELASSVAASASTPVHMQGMAHLVAALAAAVRGNEGAANDHLDEATEIAQAIDTDDSPWTKTDFGRANVGIWRVTVGVELGHGAKVAELAPTIRLADVPVHRQATFWADLGRGLLTDKRRKQKGLAAILRAEELSPQKTRHNAFVRDAVTNLLTTARRDAGGEDLRGLAWRMGINPVRPIG